MINRNCHAFKLNRRSFSVITVNNLSRYKKHSAMALSLNMRIFWITCFAIVSYASPIIDVNDATLYLENIGYLEKPAHQETLAIKGQGAVSSAVKNSRMFPGVNEKGEMENETSAMMKMQRRSVKDKIENRFRNKRYVQEDYPDLCQDAKIDAITRVQSGSAFVFKGRHYWKLLNNEIAEGYPRPISEDWDTLEGDLDAVVTFPSGDTYFFKGRRYWRFYNKEIYHGYPKQISDGFPGLTDYLDAAFVWGVNNKVFFFKGNQYWKYDTDNDPFISSSYPKPISEWHGLPADGVDAAIHWGNGYTDRSYFFKGDQWYRYNDTTWQVDDYFPRPTGTWWFGCPSPS